MGKDPAFLFYPGDWMGGTSLMNRYEKGCYMDLLMAQFHNGHLSIDDIKILLGDADYEKYWPRLSKKFKIDSDGMYYNERLEEEKNKRSGYTESRRVNRKKSEENKHMSDHMTNHMNEHMIQHMENENENRNKDIKEKGVQGEKPTAAEKRQELAKEMLAYLNLKSGRNQDTENKNAVNRVVKILASGVTPDQIMAAVDEKVRQWAGTEMALYLRNETIFGPKFNTYLDEALALKSGKLITIGANVSKSGFPLTTSQKITNLVNHGQYLTVEDELWASVKGSTIQGRLKLDGKDIVLEQAGRVHLVIYPDDGFKSNKLYDLKPGNTIQKVYEVLKGKMIKTA